MNIQIKTAAPKKRDAATVLHDAIVVLIYGVTFWFLAAVIVTMPTITAAAFTSIFSTQ